MDYIGRVVKELFRYTLEYSIYLGTHYKVELNGKVIEHIVGNRQSVNSKEIEFEVFLSDDDCQCSINTMNCASTLPSKASYTLSPSESTTSPVMAPKLSPSMHTEEPSYSDHSVFPS